MQIRRMLKEHHKLSRYAIKGDGDRLGLAGYTYLWAYQG